MVGSKTLPCGRGERGERKCLVKNSTLTRIHGCIPAVSVEGKCEGQAFPLTTVHYHPYAIQLGGVRVGLGLVYINTILHGIACGW